MSDGHSIVKADSLDAVGSLQREAEPEGAQVKSRLQFTVSDIPLLLFGEISRHLGIGEEDFWKNPENDNYTKGRDLDPAHPHIGFKARISFRKIRETAYFELWDKDILDFEKRHEDISYPFLRVVAGIQSAGIWAYGHGNLMAESGSVHFRMEDFSLQSPSLRLIALITFRASQMATNPNRVPGERYWQAERNPAGDYTDPD
ncbi:hypothetical protein HY406_01670 [Candidatus Giovannonibacteria bacterium]|nr:hypothetical protein [Candidatus Giovannonibacteria bacterium]